MEGKYTIKLPPTKDKDIKLEKYTEDKWEFYWSNEKMMPSKEMDLLMKELKVTHLPEIFFGYNRLYMVNKENDFCYQINPIDMINLTNFEERAMQKSKDMIYYEPTDAKVQYHSIWKENKKHRDDIKEFQAKADWSYASSYMGSYSHLSDCPIASILGYNTSMSTKSKTITVEKTDMELPLDRLGTENPIKQYIAVNLYADELNDNGLSEAKIRFRVMKDCFFGLLRSYIRIDNVVLRTIDTRIFHSFSDNFILRSFIVKEATYEDLKEIGFDCSSSWALSSKQSDMFSQKINETVINVSDKVYLNTKEDN